MPDVPSADTGRLAPRIELATGRDVRRACREGRLTGTTAGHALGFVQANLAMVPKALAFDFLLFCQRNPKPCPVLDVTDPGNPEPARVAPGADLRTDLPRYRIWRKGELVDEPTELSAWWRDDLVGFLLGCSFSFEKAMLGAGLPVRHLETGGDPPMFITNIETVPAGPFRGPMVVSMRPMTPAEAIKACQVTGRYARTHGAPVQIGDPAAIGIRDVAKPDFGPTVEIRPGEVPVFWACGVTPQSVAMTVKPEIMITHSPGRMFVTDLRDEEVTLG